MNKDISQITTFESGVMQATAHRVLTRIMTDYLSQFGLTSTQWYVIGHVSQAGGDGIRLNDLMHILDTTMPFITNTVNLLESKGILQKVSSSDDSRVKIARLSPNYKKRAEQIEEGLRDELRQRLYREDNINRDELSAYITVLYKIAKSKDAV